MYKSVNKRKSASKSVIKRQGERVYLNVSESVRNRVCVRVSMCAQRKERKVNEGGSNVGDRERGSGKGHESLSGKSRNLYPWGNGPRKKERKFREGKFSVDSGKEGVKDEDGGTANQRDLKSS